MDIQNSDDAAGAAVSPASDGASAPDRPSQGANPLASYRAGVADVFRTPGFYILGLAMVGFGALARDAGFSLGQAMAMTAFIFQLPGQIAFVDQYAQGAGLLAVAFAVTLTAVRLLPMTVVLQPYLRAGGVGRLGRLGASHFVAITAWVECMRRLPLMAPGGRFAYFVGFGSTITLGMIVATAVGHLASAETSAGLAAVFLFLTPMYFAVSLASTASLLEDRLAVGLGAVTGPVMFLLAPGLDLALTGVIAGGAAYAAGRATRRWKAEAPAVGTTGDAGATGDGEG